MNRAIILTTLALTLTGGSLARAAEKPQASTPAAAVLENAPRGTVVHDDDDGRAQIIPRRTVPSQEATYHGGPVVAHGVVQAVFLGSGWRERENRGKESEVLKALQGLNHQESLARYGVKGWELAAQPLEDPAGDPLNGPSISDLEIQHRLNTLLSGADSLDPNAVYVVFLAPGLGSTLGKATDKDFAAYHNHFHPAAGTVHYVVVPYDGDLSRWASAARKSLHQALINPEGNGWY